MHISHALRSFPGPTGLLHAQPSVSRLSLQGWKSFAADLVQASEEFDSIERGGKKQKKPKLTTVQARIHGES